MSRRSPTGPPTSSLDVMESFTRKTSNTGDIPIPYFTARSRTDTGTVFTRVTPALSTWLSATARMPMADSDSLSSLARAARQVVSSEDPFIRSSGNSVPPVPSSTLAGRIIAPADRRTRSGLARAREARLCSPRSRGGE
jgi:hypothetical protein